jgi:hypothetical protein
MTKLTKAQEAAARRTEKAAAKARDDARDAALEAIEFKAIKAAWPEFAAAYSEANLPRRFHQRVLSKCRNDAEKTAIEAAEEAAHGAYGAAYLKSYAKALPRLLAKAREENDALDPAA